MKKAEEYRHHAEECRILARGAVTPKERRAILETAEMWEKLARERVAMQEQQARTSENPIVQERRQILATAEIWEKLATERLARARKSLPSHNPPVRPPN